MQGFNFIGFGMQQLAGYPSFTHHHDAVGNAKHLWQLTDKDIAVFRKMLMKPENK